SHQTTRIALPATGGEKVPRLLRRRRRIHPRRTKRRGAGRRHSGARRDHPNVGGAPRPRMGRNSPGSIKGNQGLLRARHHAGSDQKGTGQRQEAGKGRWASSRRAKGERVYLSARFGDRQNKSQEKFVNHLTFTI